MDTRGVPLMAYSPIEQGQIADGDAVAGIASQHRMTRWQVALAWVLRRPGTLVIPKTSRTDHLRANHAAQALRLSEEELARLDVQFAPPRRSRPLEML
jgi:diketogulonate reductase-like aldo/keto reductase